MPRIVFDIETTPRKGIMDTWYPMWAATKYPDKEGQELEDMAALHAEFGQVCCISYANAFSDEKPISFVAGDEEAEKQMLLDLKDIFDDERTILMGHNIKGFDIPFLAKRYLVHLHKVPKALNFGGKKPWEIPHKDSMEILRFGGGASMSLRSACLMLGIDDPKGSVCGSEVPELFRKGALNTIAEYCEGDVCAERELINRLVEGMS